MIRSLSRPGVVLSALALAASVTTGALAAGPRTASAPAVAFTPGLLRGLSSVVDLGPLPATQTLDVAVMLQRPDPQGEAAFRRDVSTPGTADFRHFLTPAQFARRFGVTAGTYATARSYLIRDGLTVVASSAARDELQVRGTVSQVEATFATSLHTFQGTARSFYANTTAPRLPAGLPVAGIYGLESFHHQTLKSQQDSCDPLTGMCEGNTTAQDLWKAYDLPAGLTGKGQKVATFGLGATDYVVKDLRSFETAEQLPQVPVRVVHVDPDGTYADTSGDGEWQIDTQSATGLAPDADELIMYWANDSNSDASFQNMIKVWADDPQGSQQGSASFGECEAQPGDPGAAVTSSGVVSYDSVEFQTTYDDTLKQLIAEGRTLFASSGDNGSSCGPLNINLNGVANEGVPQVDYPASSPYAVGVGGTVLYTNQADSTRAQEYAWTFGGGGSSVLYPEPEWQQAVGLVQQPCLGDPDGTPNPAAPTCRGVPDISSQSGDVSGNGFKTYDANDLDGSGTGYFSGGGTSLSSPMSEGMWARVQSAVGGLGAGYANPIYYRYCNDAFDVGQTGNTETNQLGNGAYTAKDGWDYATGLGVPDITQLSQDAVALPAAEDCAGLLPGTQPAGTPPRPTPTSSAPTGSPSSQPSSPSPTGSTPSSATPTPSASPTPAVATSGSNGSVVQHFTPLGYRTVGSLNVASAGASIMVPGHGGIPRTGVTRVLLSLTTHGSTRPGFVRTGSTPLVPATPARERHSLVLVTLPSDGRLPLRIDAGATKVVVHAVGYSSAGSPSAYRSDRRTIAGSLVTVTPGHAVTLTIPGAPTGRHRSGFASLVRMTLVPSRHDGLLSASVAGKAARLPVTTYTDGLRSSATFVVEPDAKGKVTFSVSAGSVSFTAAQLGTWSRSSSGSAFGHWSDGRVTAV